MSVTEVVMPSMGADMSEGSIARWLKKEGDPVSRGDILAEVETDKAVVEMEAYGSGVLRKIIIGEGIIVPVGRLIALIAEPTEDLPTIPNDEVSIDNEPDNVAASSANSNTNPQEIAAQTATIHPRTGRIKSSPVARRLAKEHGISLETIIGTGPDNRIIRSDIESVISAKESTGAQEPEKVFEKNTIPLTPMRQAIAKTVIRSKTDQPDFYVTVAVDMTNSIALRTSLNEVLKEENIKISVNDLVIRATVMAIEKMPKWNMSYNVDSLLANSTINIGIAIALDDGLVVPSIPDCQHKSLRQLAIEAHSLGERARAGRLSEQEMTGGTFSISNLGMFGIEEFSAILVPPQAGILAVGAITPTPVAHETDVVIRHIMKATLTVDHRVNDGAEAAIFIGRIKMALENPLSLLV